MQQQYHLLVRGTRQWQPEWEALLAAHRLTLIGIFEFLLLCCDRTCLIATRQRRLKHCRGMLQILRMGPQVATLVQDQLHIAGHGQHWTALELVSSRHWGPAGRRFLAYCNVDDKHELRRSKVDVHSMARLKRLQLGQPFAHSLIAYHDVTDNCRTIRCMRSHRSNKCDLNLQTPLLVQKSISLQCVQAHKAPEAPAKFYILAKFPLALCTVMVHF